MNITIAIPIQSYTSYKPKSILF